MRYDAATEFVLRVYRRVLVVGGSGVVAQQARNAAR